MKIKKEVLKQFLRETALAGENTLTEVKLDFNENGLCLTAITDGNAIMVKAQLISTAFEDYAAIGKIGIINYGELSRVVETLTDNIEINKDGNVLVFKGGRKVDVPLADESLIKDISKIPNLTYDYTFTLCKKVFDDIEKNISFALNKSDSKTIQFTGKNKALTVKYGTKYKFEDAVAVDEINADEIDVRFGEVLLNAVANIEGDLTVQMKSNFPITIMKKTDMYAIKIIVAPKV